MALVVGGAHLRCDPFLGLSSIIFRAVVHNKNGMCVEIVVEVSVYAVWSLAETFSAEAWGKLKSGTV